MGTNWRRLGNYELEERVGPAAAGEFWKAFDTQQRRYVSIKIIQVSEQNGTDFTPRFYHEAQILAALHHPNIVQVHDFFISQSGYEAYVIMDYVEGLSLADYLSATAHMGKIPPPTEIIHLLAPVADALDYAHQRGVLHGALRPAAILLDKALAIPPAPGEAKLSDFGLHLLPNPLALPLDDVAYISPEVAQGFTGTKASDLYALGVILYEMCTGALPFQGDTTSDILMRHIHGVPTSPTLINPYIPPALTGIIIRSLAKDPTTRYSTATTLVAAVARALNIGMPESSNRAHTSGGAFNPSSLSGLDTMNSPTYTSQPPQQPLAPTRHVPPVVAGSSTPALPPPPFTSSSTPVLPMAATAQTAQSPLAISANTPAHAARQDSSQTPQTARQTLPEPAPVRPARKKRPGWLYIALAALLLVALAGSAFGAYLFFFRGAPAPQNTPVGHAFFVSSGLLSSANSSQGIADELQINLQNLPDPQPGKRYYAWLLNDKEIDFPAAAIGPLPLNRHQVTMTYSDGQHGNLLANYGHFLVTEEDASQPPANPSLDTNTWRYAAKFSITPSPADTVNHFSLLDHLRHLLSQDPKLKLVGLGGGLDIWLFRNTSKLLEAAGSARDAQQSCTPDPNNGACAFVHRALVRMLDYLDGSAYAWMDVPPNTPVLIDPTIARVALLESDPLHQQPPGYLTHIGTHLRELAISPGVSADQRALAIRITRAINNVQGWLVAAHGDAVKLLHMDNTQLSQPQALSMLDDMYRQANYAFVGQFDPNTTTVKEGVVQIHYNIQGLATFDVTPCTTINGKNTCS